MALLTSRHSFSIGVHICAAVWRHLTQPCTSRAIAQVWEEVSLYGPWIALLSTSVVATGCCSALALDFRAELAPGRVFHKTRVDLRPDTAWLWRAHLHLSRGTSLGHKQDCQRVGCRSRSPKSQVILRPWGLELKNTSFQIRGGKKNKKEKKKEKKQAEMFVKIHFTEGSYFGIASSVFQINHAFNTSRISQPIEPYNQNLDVNLSHDAQNQTPNLMADNTSCKSLL